MSVESIVRRINLPALTRVWIEGNLKWAVAEAFLAGAALGALVLAHFLTSALLWGLSAALFLAFVFGYAFMGVKRGLFLKPLCRVPAAGNPIILTFDDGPHPVHSPRLLDILKEYDVPAVFFLAGKNVRRHPQIVRRMECEGHETGCHTWSHSNLRWAGRAQVHLELTRFEQEMARMSLQRPRIFRPPNGSKNPLTEWALRARGYRLIHWTMSPKDWKESVTPATVLDRLKEYTEPGAIILLHDSANAVAALPDYIEWARAQGMRFARLGEYLHT